MGACGGEATDCGCGGSCGDSAGAPVADTGEPDSLPGPPDAASESCDGTCDGRCEGCVDRQRAGIVNWGRLQANSKAVMSEFWRQAVIGDTLTRTTGETLPGPMLPVLSDLAPEFEIERFRDPASSFAFGGWLPTVVPERHFTRMQHVDPFYVPVASNREWAEEYLEEAIWSDRRIDLEESEELTDDKFGSTLTAQSAPFTFVAAGDGEGAKKAEVSGEPYSDKTTNDSKECASLWENTFYSDGKGSCGIGRNLVGCEQVEDCEKEGEKCRIKADKSGCKCSPPPPKYECCCCVESVTVDRKRNNPKRVRKWTQGSDRYLGHVFTVLVNLKHHGKTGTTCKCTLTWQEYTTRAYRLSNGRMVEAEKWSNLPPPSNWGSFYGNIDKPTCVDKTIGLPDRPNASVTFGRIQRRQLWIVVCAFSCEDAEADCKCEKSEDCLTIYQEVRETAPGQGSADIYFSDDEADKKRMQPPPPGRPGKDGEK